MPNYQKKIFAIYLLFALIIGECCPKNFAQAISPTPTPTTAISPSPTVVISSPTPSIIISPTPTSYPPLKIIIYALSACPSDGLVEFVQLQNLESFSIQINNWQLIDLAGGTENLTELNFVQQEILKINLDKVKLNNSGDELSLYDQNHNLIDKVSYQNCKKDQIIFFHQVTVSPTPTPQITPSATIEPTSTTQVNQTNLTNPTVTPTSGLSIDQKNSTSKPAQNPNYKMPLIETSKYAKSPPHLPQQNLTVKSTLLTPLLIDRWPILSVIIGGTTLITLGAFLIYEESIQIN